MGMSIQTVARGASIGTIDSRVGRQSRDQSSPPFTLADPSTFGIHRYLQQSKIDWYAVRHNVGVIPA